MKDGGKRSEGKILVVDDSPDIRELLTETLLSHNYAVIDAVDGNDGFRKFTANPDICFVITDMDMPVLNGLELIHKIRETNTEVPIVVLTGRKEVATAIKVIHAGADDYILKDENIREELLIHTRKVFEKRKITDEIKRLNVQLNLRNEFIKKTFGRYMSDEVVEKLLESPDGLKLGGETLKVTIMMTDLRGFSAISEKYPPATVVDMLNSYLKDMTDVISKYSGTINEIIGDAMLVLFGAPTTRPDDADRALACALEMQLAMEGVNKRHRERNLPELEMGIGINTGNVVAGNVGSEIRVKYAVVGSNVNLAGRVESFTVGGQILITEATLNDCSARVDTGGEFHVPFKGIEKPVTIYELTGIRGNYNISLPAKQLNFVLLKRELPVTFEVLEGKHSSGEKSRGEITHLAEKYAVLHATEPLAPLSNLKITVPDGFETGREAILYAKVLRGRKDMPSGHEINFTFIPPEIGAFFETLKK